MGKLEDKREPDDEKILIPEESWIPEGVTNTVKSVSLNGEIIGDLEMSDDGFLQLMVKVNDKKWLKIITYKSYDEAIAYMWPKEYYQPTKILCMHCNDIIYSRYSGEFRGCSCGKIAIDERYECYIRIIGEERDYIGWEKSRADQTSYWSRGEGYRI